MRAAPAKIAPTIMALPSSRALVKGDGGAGCEGGGADEQVHLGDALGAVAAVAEDVDPSDFELPGASGGVFELLVEDVLDSF
jgi:hypothetical protein